MDERQNNSEDNRNRDNVSYGGAHSGNLTYPAHREERWVAQTSRIVYYVLGVVEVLLAFRFLFKLLGANTVSGFVVFLYAVTKIFVLPFTGIFSSVSSAGGPAGYIFEPATLVAMIVYAIVARGIVSLVRLRMPHGA